MTDPIPLRQVELYRNEDAIAKTRKLLERLESGETVACGIVDIRRGGTVANAYSNSEMGHYHQLLSGAARLFNRIVSEPEDYFEKEE